MCPPRTGRPRRPAGPAVLLQEVACSFDGDVCPPGRAGHVRLQHLRPAAGAGIAVGERGEERAVESGQRVHGAAVQAGTGAGGSQPHQQRELARPGAEGLVGERRVVGRQDRVRDVRLGGPLHEEARGERRELLGETLVVEEHLLHRDGSVRAGVAGPLQPARQRGVGRVERRVGGDDPADETGRGGEDGQADGAAPVLHDQCHVGEADGGDELRQPVDMGPHRVRRPGHGLVGAPEADQVRGHGAQPVLGQAGHHRAVEVRPRGLAVQQEDGLGVGRALVDVVHAQAVGQGGVARGEGETGKDGEALLGCPHDLHGAHSAAPLATGGRA